jgi:Heavy metal binding domain
MLNGSSLLRQVSLAVLLVLPALSPAWPQQPQLQQTVAQLAQLIDGELKELASSPPAERLQKITATASQQLDSLRAQSIMVVGPRLQELEKKFNEFEGLIAQANSPASTNNYRETTARLGSVWAQIKALYPKEALQILPPLWSCPMHQDLMERAAGNCPICGMPLEPIYVTQPQLTQAPIIRAEILSNRPLEVGKRADLRIRLSFSQNNQPVKLDDLEEQHTRKIHLLISDISETDYHHEHPEPVGDGEYAFSFTPAKPDTYRLWADLMPVQTRVQQYSVADIPSTTPRRAQLAQDEPENRHVEIDGYKFDLWFEKQLIHERETVAGKVRVTQADGEPCRKLGVVMGAFGHFVGFGDDFSTVLHLHPVGALITDPNALGGPELPFYFRSSKVGLFRLFTQVKIAGKDYFPRFVVRVEPLQHLPGG